MVKTAVNRKPGRPANREIRMRRQEEILDAAAKLFAKRGYSEANTQQLADVLHVGKGTIYRYFPTKRELFLAAADRMMQQPTYFAYRDANVERHREHIRALIGRGRLRDVPEDRIGDVIGDLLYGTMFTNYFAGRSRSPREQADDILDIVFHGVLSDAERKRRGVK